jgi:hypothetical protein
MKTSSSESGQKIPLLVDSKTILKQPQQNFIFQRQQNLQQHLSPSNIPQPQPPMPQQTFLLPKSLYQQQQLQSSSPSAKSTSTPHKPQQPSSLPPHKQFSSRHQHKQQTWKAPQLYHPYYHCHSYHHHHQPQVNKNKPSDLLKESVAMTSLPRESVISIYIIGCIIILSRISVSLPILKELIAIIAVAGYFYSTIGLLFLIGYHSFMTVYYIKQYGADILTFGKKY